MFHADFEPGVGERMPTWNRPSDVHFDHAAAQQALDAIAATRFTLERAWAAEGTSAASALASWEGVAAATFRSSHAVRERATLEIGDRLRVLASAIEDAADQAAVEQARIDMLQAEWDAQHRLEMRLAAEARAGANEGDRTLDSARSGRAGGTPARAGDPGSNTGPGGAPAGLR